MLYAAMHAFQIIFEAFKIKSKWNHSQHHA